MSGQLASGGGDWGNLLDEDTLNKNVAGIKKQLEKFLDFNAGTTAAELVNNYDWMKQFSFLEFIREVGKFITISYMMAKDSVQNRLETGMSFTEFSYQLLQGYDFYWLYKNKNCKLQMGGSDQWGNITTGTELIRRKDSGEAFALTTQLIKKADGTKFGKSESGNIWLDREKTNNELKNYLQDKFNLSSRSTVSEVIINKNNISIQILPVDYIIGPIIDIALVLNRHPEFSFDKVVIRDGIYEFSFSKKSFELFEKGEINDVQLK